MDKGLKWFRHEARLWQRLALAAVLTAAYALLILGVRHLDPSAAKGPAGALTNSPIFRLATEQPADFVTDALAGSGTVRASAPPVAIVTYDDESFPKGSRFATIRRQHLSDVLRLIEVQEPASIFVDLDLGYDAPGEAEGTDALYQTLKALDQNQDGPPVFLYRPQRSDEKYPKHPVRFVPTTVRSNSLDATGPIDKQVGDEGQLQWFNATFVQDEDGQTRWMSAWRTAPDLEGKLSVALSAGYAVRLLQDGGLPLLMQTQTELASQAEGIPKTSLQSYKNGMTAAWLQEGVRHPNRVSRVMFNTRDPFRASGIPLSARSYVDLHPIRYDAGMSGLRLEGGALSDKIVIIGRSDQYSGDTIQTPIGSVPGIFVVAQSLKTVTSYDAPIAIATLPSIAFAFAIFAIFLLMLRYQNWAMSVFYTVIISLICMIPFAFFYSQGIWIDLGAPTAIISAIGALVELIEKGANVFRLGRPSAKSAASQEE
ncbi:hypothetical protein ABI_22960 [Asticcacaulis biprosthecium C19]|uniref:CHASE2 domain-containing protein n=1 Tax=Asticcacaulis biprosthecium C19 TaxID=715226 RepID=F4QNH6_9CAUL|nr:CHASE2 domain-containing protein [Asticcacaulis biprosthecium]EGF90884.1 hypothetical protein ABI_22960 [Asticcacaulis biprosthecium C19]